jgi:hypothetical protein
MQNWKFTCTDGFTKNLMAATKEEAVKMFMMDAEMQEHVKTKHPDLAAKTPEEMTAVVMSMVAPMVTTPTM